METTLDVRRRQYALSGGLLARARTWARAVVDACVSSHALPALDGLRALAASLVFVVHYQAAFGRLLAGFPRLHSAGDYAAAVGYHGVSVFFVLSGFLIYGSLVGKRVSFLHFFRRRVERIYPTYLVVLGIYLLLGVTFQSRSKLPRTGLLSYLLANVALLPGVFPIRPIITVAWSLSYEIFFYVALGIAAALLRLRAWGPSFRIMFMSSLGLVWLCGDATFRAAVGSFIMFLPGLFLWELWAARRNRLRTGALRVAQPRAGGAGDTWGGGGLILLFGVVLTSLPAIATAPAAERLLGAGLAPSTITFALLTLAVVPLFWAALVGTRPAVTRILGGKALRFLGGISYSFYLIHGLTINALAWLLAPVLRNVTGIAGPVFYLLFIIPSFCAAVTTATLLFRSVEQRFSLQTR